jgi:glycosyltransferase involved in cell wall biosynthesis
VLHDLRLHHFFDDIFRVNWRDLDSYLAVMESYYGEEGRRDASECFHTNARNIDHMAEHYPLTQLAVEHQLGIVVHTPEAFAVLAREQNCPIVLAPLPFSAKQGSQTSKPAAPPYRLIVFGYIGRSRRLNSMLKALADLPEKAQFQLDIYGDILDGEDQLRTQIRTLELKQRVHLHGFATESKLDEALAQSHLAINLRYPTMGEASGSQLRIWSHSLPALVSRIGWYETLPPATVAFVRTDENEVADIQHHLRALTKDPTSFAEMGQRGRQVLADEHGPERYAQTIIEMARLSGERRPLIAADRLAERSGVLLSEWFDSKAVAEAGTNVAKQIFELSRSN